MTSSGTKRRGVERREDSASLPDPVRKRPGSRRRRRTASAIVSSLSVLGFAVAIIAPTAVALTDPPTIAQADEHSVFSLAVEDTQLVEASVQGAESEPMARGVFDIYVTPTPEPVVASVSSGSSGGGTSASTPLTYSGGGSPAEWMAAAGIAESDWGYVDYIASRESGWNPNATNRSSGACGLIQAYPCSKVPGSGYNPVDNLRWANGYAVGRYGSWASAYAFWTSNHWW